MNLNYEPLQARLLEFVAQADRARQRFQDARDAARGTPDALAAELELIRFYGQTFVRTVCLLSEAADAAPWLAALEQAVRGRTACWEWQRRPTALVSPLELHEMEARWETLRLLVRDCA